MGVQAHAKSRRQERRRPSDLVMPSAAMPFGHMRSAVDYAPEDTHEADNDSEVPFRQLCLNMWTAIGSDSQALPESKGSDGPAQFGHIRSAMVHVDETIDVGKVPFSRVRTSVLEVDETSEGSSRRRSLVQRVRDSMSSFSRRPSLA